MQMMRRRWIFAPVVSVAASAVAVRWLIAPESYPYGSADIVRTGVNHLIERDPMVVMLIAAAALGIVLAASSPLAGAIPRRLVGVGAALEAGFFAFVVGDAAILPALGYVVAWLAPIGVIAVVALACLKRHPIGYALAFLLVALGAAMVATGTDDVVVQRFRDWVADSAVYSTRITWSLGMACAAAVWAWLALGSLTTWQAWATSERVLRWGKRATIAAALCLVPYGLARFSWLTPWHLLQGDPSIKGDDQVALFSTLPIDGATKVQGVLFGLACVVGVALTLGLISRWGEVFPRWIPILSGRPVPVRLAVIPAAVVAATICISGPGFVLAHIESGGVRGIAQGLFFFPFPIWGPALAIATLAYWQRRTGQRETMPSGVRGRDRQSAPSALGRRSTLVR